MQPSQGAGGSTGYRLTSRSLAGPIALAATALALVGLLGWSATHADLPQFRGKAMAGRLVCFPIAASLVPLGWWWASRRRGRWLPFPYAPAVLVTWPFVIDLFGNATRLYVDVEYFDDAVHAINPVLFVAALALLLDRTRVPRWSSWVMAFGLGYIERRV